MNQDLILYLWFGGVPIVICVIALASYSFDRGRVSDKAIMPIYERPKNLSFLEFAMIYDEIIHIKDISLFILDMSFREHLDVEAGDKELILKKLHGRDELSMFEMNALDEIFGNREVIHLDSNATLKRFEEIKEILERELMKKKLFLNTFFSRDLFYGMGCASFMAGLAMLFASFLIFGFNIFTLQGFIISFSFVYIYFIVLGILFGLTARKLLTRTRKGVDELRKLLGFKEFIVTAEKDRIKALMENERKHYESILPFAIMFGVENKWVDDEHAIRIGLLRHTFTEICKEVQYDDYRMIFEGERLTLRLIFNFIYSFFKGIYKMIMNSFSKKRNDY
jgi:uncharacterized membrane protein